MAVGTNFDKELFKQKIIQQIKNKDSDLYYLLRTPHHPDLLKQNVLLLNPEYDLNICLNLIPAYDVYQVDFSEGPVDYDFYGKNKIWNIAVPQITDIYCEDVVFKKNLAIFELKQFRLSNMGSEIKATLLNKSSISYNIETGKWALDLKEYDNALQFIRYLDNMRQRYNETYLSYRVTPNIFKDMMSSGCVDGKTLHHRRFISTMKNAREYSINFWTLKGIIENIFYDRPM